MSEPESDGMAAAGVVVMVAVAAGLAVAGLVELVRWLT